MLMTGTEVYVVLAGRGDRASLHCGNVVESERDDVIVSFTEPIRPVVGSDVAFHYPKTGEFARASATVLAVPEDASHTIVRFAVKTGSEIVEGRGAVRIAVAHAGAAVEVDGLPGCSLLDVSEGGFALSSPVELQVGTAMQIGVQHGDEYMAGIALVRAVQPQRDGSFRCGFCIPAGEINLRLTMLQIGADASNPTFTEHAKSKQRRCA